MKIALVRTASNQLTLGSYNIQEIGLAKALLKYNVSIDIYARFSNLKKKQILEHHKNSKITLIPLVGFNIFREIMFYPSLQNALLSGNYDFVQLEDDSQIMVPFLLRNLTKKGVNTILWQGMYRNFDSTILSSLQKLYDFVFKDWINNYSTLKFAKTLYAKSYLLDKGYDNIKLLPVGLDNLPFGYDQDLINRVLQFKKTKPKTLLYVGAIDQRRDVLFLIEILNQIKNKGFGLIIVGDGPYREKVLKRASQLKIEDHLLHFRKLRNDKVSCLYQNSDLFLLPTKYEIYGMVILEALKFGLPVISTKEAGPHTILNDPKLGVCLDLKKEKWINAIQIYSQNFNNDRASKYRKQVIIETYNWNKIAHNYYQKLSNSIK